MWKLYSQSVEAIAIQSTYRKLRDSFEPRVVVGLVQYIDYDKTVIQENNIYNYFMFKRKSFAHEQELRAIFDLPKEAEEEMQRGGTWLKVDLDRLIEKVYVAPTSLTWFKELVVQVMNRYGLQKAVMQSGLDREPLY